MAMDAMKKHSRLHGLVAVNTSKVLDIIVNKLEDMHKDLAGSDGVISPVRLLARGVCEI